MMWFVVGNIGAGKTRYVHLLKARPDVDIESINEERVVDWGKDFEEFCSDMDKFRAKFNMNIIDDTLMFIQKRLNIEIPYTLTDLFKSFFKRQPKNILFERGPLCTQAIFSHKSFFVGRDEEYDQLQAYLTYHIDREFTNKYDGLINFVYVRASPAKCLERVRLRNRKGEENITLEYLQQLHDIHEEVYAHKTITFANRQCSVLVLENEIDDNDSGEEDVIEQMGVRDEKFDSDLREKKHFE